MTGFENCKWGARVRVRFPISSTDIAIEACELLGAEICLRHQDTHSRQLAFRKPGWGACSQPRNVAQEWRHTALPGPQGPERSLAGTPGERGGRWPHDFSTHDGTSWCRVQEGSDIIKVLAPISAPLTFVWTIPHPGSV